MKNKIDLTEVQEHFESGWPAWIECSGGWNELILNTHIRLKELDPDYKINQIKEKFGGLRYYIATGTDEMWAIVNEAENTSYEICEVCGEPGRPNNEGWIRTLCEEHNKE